MKKCTKKLDVDEFVDNLMWIEGEVIHMKKCRICGKNELCTELSTLSTF